MSKASMVVEKALSRRYVVFHGTCDHLPLISADALKGPNGKIIEQTPGLRLRFQNNVTRAYDMEYAADKREVEAIREYLDEHGQRDVRINKFDVKELEPDAAPAPFNNFSNFNAKKIVELAQMLMPEDEASQEVFLEQCVAYEAQNKNRKTVIEALGELLDNGIDDDDLVEVEVDL